MKSFSESGISIRSARPLQHGSKDLSIGQSLRNAIHLRGQDQCIT
ncbi:hypothetical protein BAL199_17883 [alpha proteobacterium BAL199]|nr:hypothetical protein BAL199_17883 [alpha proteobacterium BAL199]